MLEDNRIEVPGYKKAKEKDSIASFNRMIGAMNLDPEKNPIKITVSGDLLAGSGVGASAASAYPLPGHARGIQSGNGPYRR